MPDSEVAGVAASAAALLRFRQRLVRTIRRQVIVDRSRRKPSRRSNRSVGLDCHVSTRSLPGGSGRSPPDPCPYKFSAYSGIFSPAFSRTYAFFQSGRYPTNLPRRRSLPSKLAVRTESTFTLKMLCTACLISVLLAL